MGYTSVTRDRYRLAVAAVSGLATAGALCATALIAGEAAADFKVEQAERDAQGQASATDERLQRREYRALVKAYDKYNETLAANAADPRVLIRERREVVRPRRGTVDTTVGPGGSVEPSPDPSNEPTTEPTDGGGGQGGGGTSDPTEPSTSAPPPSAPPTSAPPTSAPTTSAPPPPSAPPPSPEPSPPPTTSSPS
jgi:hypothetical protein